MKRLEIMDLYELGANVDRLARTLRGDKVKPIEVWTLLSAVETSIKKFIEGQAAFPLSRDSAREVERTIDEVLVGEFYADRARSKFKDDMDFTKEMHSWTFSKVQKKLEEFSHVFSAECRKCETYFIEQKLGFDLPLLLHDADQNLHSSIRDLLPKPAVDEVKAAGRCFALENYTACGFHVLRALEVVMADYYKMVSGKNKEFRSWYDYTEEFTKLEKSRTKRNSKFPSPKVAAMLDRMRQLDRNPLMHPRDSLDEMAADTLFKLGIVTITELAKDMREMAGQPELRLEVADGAKAA